MSADKYYTAVFLKVVYADSSGAVKKHFHRIESTKLAHYFLADQAPRTYQDPVWRKLRDRCKTRCDKVIMQNYKFVGDPSTEQFYLKHILEAPNAISADHEDSHVYEIRAKMYPWSDVCDADTLKKDDLEVVYTKDTNSKNDLLEEVNMDEIPVSA